MIQNVHEATQCNAGEGADHDSHQQTSAINPQSGIDSSMPLTMPRAAARSSSRVGAQSQVRPWLQSPLQLLMLAVRFFMRVSS